MESPAFDAAEVFNRAVRACREDRWREGYALLTDVARAADRGGNLPGVFYSYLGVAMARCEGRKRDGLELCRYAAQRQPKEAENHLNLAMVYLMVGRRAAAIRAVHRGLKLRPGHRRLRELHQALGMRKRPLFPFLSRASPINVLSGKVRAWAARRKLELREEREERAALAE